MNANHSIKQAGWVLYDGDCPLCICSARRFERVLRRAGFALATLQSRNAGLTEMLVLLPDDCTLGGADGIVQIARRIWWAWPLFAFAQIPGAMPLLRAGYRQLATNRHCISGTCRVPDHNPLVTWLPLILLPTATLFLRTEVPAWVFMWAMAFSLYAGCKWLTYREAIRNGANATSLRAAGYLLAWPGMDAKTFLGAKTFVDRPHLGEWLFASVKTLFGAALVWFVVGHFPQDNESLTGWTGMVGVIFLLHFGSFHLVSLAWRATSVNAAPLMQNPLRAVSLAEFWGKRWNTAFHELVYRFTFRPMARRIGATGATLLVFLLSGLVHELVISLPAHGGYGLPTGYFLIQGLGVAGEHTQSGRRIGLGRGWRGWLFTMFVVIAPAFWLFHPPFIRTVILPMLHGIGAT